MGVTIMAERERGLLLADVAGFESLTAEKPPQTNISAAMSSSSVSVIGNALRLRHARL